MSKLVELNGRTTEEFAEEVFGKTNSEDMDDLYSEEWEEEAQRLLDELLGAFEDTILPIKEIKFDDGEGGYQREQKIKHLEIARNFMKEAYERPTVGRRADGSLWCVNGRQRLSALELLRFRRAPCRIFSSNGREHEATVFEYLNGPKTVTRMSQAELFRSGLARNDPTVLTVKRVAEEEGFTVVRSKGGKRTLPSTLCCQLSCHSTLRKVVDNWGEDALRFALNMIRRSWPDDPQRVGLLIIGSLALFYHRYKGATRIGKRSGGIKPDVLLYHLQSTSPIRITQVTSSRVSGISGGDRFGKACDFLVELYGRRVRGGN